MVVNLNINKVEVGMFVILPNSLFENPFWRSGFIIKSAKQIQRIVKAGFTDIKVDTDKSKIKIKAKELLELTSENNNDIDLKKEPSLLIGNAPVIDKQRNIVKNESTISAKACLKKDNSIAEDTTISKKWEPEKFMPARLVEAIKDTSIPPDERANVVQDYSRELMKNIFENPTDANILASKKDIAKIVDIIMEEDETCEGLTKIVSHDYYTYTHSVNVGVKAILLAKAFYGANDSVNNDMHELGASFFLHDIGKVNISPEIINKPGKLSIDEMNIMRTHPNESSKILVDSDHLTSQAKIIVLQHHERDDGSGYPFGLKGYEIHAYAIICSLADVYDALTGKRSYKEANPPKVALEIIKKEMSSHFNKDILNNFIDLFK